MGPLLNPAPVSFQVIGVFAPSIMELMVSVCARLNRKAACSVHTVLQNDSGGCDELTRTGLQLVHGFREPGTLFRKEWEPDAFGGTLLTLEDLRGGSAEENAAWLEKILLGNDDGPGYETVCLNAAVALWIAGKVPSMEEGLLLSKEVIHSGKAKDCLERCRDFGR